MSVVGSTFGFAVMTAAAGVGPPPHSHVAPCVSRYSAPVPPAYRQAVANARAIVCDRLRPRIPGIQVAIAVDGNLVWSQGFGYADVAKKVPVTNETQFRVGSVSKALTSAAVAQLYERGVLDLDAPVQRYVPSFPDKGYPITTRQLAGHLAGIRHYREGEFLSNRRYASVREELTIFEGDSLLFPPGTRFSYSSFGWTLVSAVIEGASGQEFLDYMSRNVFQPLGMTHTAPDRADSIMPQRSAVYDPDSLRGFVPSPAVDNSAKWAAGGFVTTAEDLVRFGSALLKPGFLNAETLDLLFTAQHTRAGEPTPCGVAWFVTTDSLGHRWVFHGGSAIGGTAVFGLDRDSRLVIAILSNLTEAPLEPARGIKGLFDR
jgi:CubicO group peptidase (beta-lactamase class C family)